MARFACMIGWGALVLALAPDAHAGPTGTSESGSSSSDGGSSSSDGGSSSSDGESSTSSESSTTTESTDSGSTTTSTDSGSDTTSTGTTTSGADETGACNMCGDQREGPGEISITSPGDGATVDAPFTVTATVTPTCRCEPCPCIELSAQYTQLFLDTVAVGAPCYQAECAWEITADVGNHTLYGAATFGPDDVVGTTIEVYVQSSAPGTETGFTTADDGPPPTSDTTGGSASVGEDAPRGCGCAAPADARAGAWLVVLAPLFRRRPRARR
ncbi:MAG TPA: hypothetical protein VG755_17420 [Nannocystaceae bacterium]|nr:hypothetical protein [Nannocystaceae bacterium]